MANELQPLSLLFQNRLFRIPDYQRGYAWQQSQLIDFWDDIINLQDDRYHYTGLLSLKELKKKVISSWGEDIWMVDAGFKACHIVDGQQRLTTFIVLLNELIEIAKAENKDLTENDIVLGFETLKDIRSKYICRHRPPNNQITTYLFGYEVDNPSAEYLKYRVFNEPYSGSVNETYYTKNLKYAKEFFKKNISELYADEGMEGLSNLYLKLTQRLMFNIHEIDDDYDVFVAFETMNNRGKKLTNLELLKNRLIYLTTLYANDKFDELDKSNLRKQINDAWKEVYYQLGRNEKTPLSDDEFLRAHWISYFSYSRKKGDDYINFLLDKFSAKNIFKKKTIYLSSGEEETSDLNYDEDELNVEIEETETMEVSKLEPSEISSYVNSLKDLAKYWYDTYFPLQSENLTQEEKQWVDKLNRIGIGYFRPLVMVIISRRDFSEEQRLKAFKAIERFIFICFRLGTYQATFRSSEYNRATRSVYLHEMNLEDLIEDIEDTTNSNIEYAIPNFVTRIEKNFDNNTGFYTWNPIRYFLYEYEVFLSQKNNIDKLNWMLFTKSEKDKVSIEHILPQTPSKYYWKNAFRQFDEDEIKLLSGALGNLLPLSQSINSSLQNDSFEDKKTSKSSGRRGYENGSHSEIEISKESDWSADRIYNRSKQLLEFMERRWKFSMTKEQLDRLVYVSFAVDGREVPDELHKEKLVETTVKSNDAQNKETNDELGNKQLQFWTAFVNYCTEEGRGDIGARKPLQQNWYDIAVPNAEFHLSFTVTRSKYITLLLYVYNPEAFVQLEEKKDKIESLFGDKFDWYSSKSGSIAKRILYRKEYDIFNPSKHTDIFEWMIEKYDLLHNALIAVGEIDANQRTEKKFDPLKEFLVNSTEAEMTLSFRQIEDIIGETLCKSAYNYNAYWNPSATHILPHTIIEAGYEIVNVDLIGKSVELKKNK